MDKDLRHVYETDKDFRHETDFINERNSAARKRADAEYEAEKKAKQEKKDRRDARSADTKALEKAQNEKFLASQYTNEDFKKYLERTITYEKIPDKNERHRFREAAMNARKKQVEKENARLDEQRKNRIDKLKNPNSDERDKIYKDIWKQQKIIDDSPQDELVKFYKMIPKDKSIFLLNKIMSEKEDYDKIRLDKLDTEERNRQMEAINNFTPEEKFFYYNYDYDGDYVYEDDRDNVEKRNEYINKYIETVIKDKEATKKIDDYNKKKQEIIDNFTPEEKKKYDKLPFYGYAGKEKYLDELIKQKEENSNAGVGGKRRTRKSKKQCKTKKFKKARNHRKSKRAK